MSIASPVPPWDGPTPAVSVAVIDTEPAFPVPMVLALRAAPDMRTDGPDTVMLPELPGMKPGAGTDPVAMLPPLISTDCVSPCVPLPVMLTLPPLPDVWVVEVKLLP